MGYIGRIVRIAPFDMRACRNQVAYDREDWPVNHDRYETSGAGGTSRGDPRPQAPAPDPHLHSRVAFILADHVPIPRRRWRDYLRPRRCALDGAPWRCPSVVWAARELAEQRAEENRWPQ